MVKLRHINGCFTLLVSVWIIKFHIDVAQQVMRGQQMIILNFLLVNFLSFRKNGLPLLFPAKRVHELDSLPQSWVKILVKCHFFKRLDLMVELINLILRHLGLSWCLGMDAYWYCLRVEFFISNQILANEGLLLV
jgi:hypothetical protein